MHNTLRSRLAACAVVLTFAVGITTLVVRPGHTSGGPVAVQVAGTVPVKVTGTASVRDLDNAAQQPFATAAYFTPRTGSTDFLFTFTVPQGKRLVIQGVSMSLYDMGANERPEISIHLQTGDTQTDQLVALPTLLDSANGRADFAVPEQAVTFYADAGTTVNVYVAGIGPTSVAKGSVYGGITGYLVNTP